eukprot:1791989-Rhodomonas_salina.2
MLISRRSRDGVERWRWQDAASAAGGREQQPGGAVERAWLGRKAGQHPRYQAQPARARGLCL